MLAARVGIGKRKLELSWTVRDLDMTADLQLVKIIGAQKGDKLN
jgi:hypothetical protein